jgi:hypothetical protein
MTSYLRKYVTALASAKDYIAQWSSDHVYADEELIVPFPTIAIFDPDKHVWTVHIKAWVYLPFQPKSFTNILPSLPTSLPSLSSFLGGNKKDEDKTEEFVDAKDKPTENTQTVFNDDDKNKLTKESGSTDDVKVDQDKKDAAATVSEEKKADGSSGEASGSDDDIYEDALRKYFYFYKFEIKYFSFRRRIWSTRRTSRSIRFIFCWKFC